MGERKRKSDGQSESAPPVKINEGAVIRNKSITGKLCNKNILTAATKIISREHLDKSTREKARIKSLMNRGNCSEFTRRDL